MFQTGMQIWAGAVLLSIFFLAGCNSNKPGKATFERTLQKYFDENPVCSGFLFKLPAEVISDGQGTFGINYTRDSSGVLTRDEYKARVLAALKSAGLVTAYESEGDVNVTYFSHQSEGWSNMNGVDIPQGTATRRLKTTTYSSAAGSSQFLRAKDNALMVCYARARVKSVDNYTEPAATGGQTTSDVSFTVSIEPIAPWINNPELIDVLRPNIMLVGTTRQSKLPLVLTHDGWKVVDKNNLR